MLWQINPDLRSAINPVLQQWRDRVSQLKMLCIGLRHSGTVLPHEISGMSLWLCGLFGMGLTR